MLTQIWTPEFIQETLKEISPEDHAIVQFYLEYEDKNTGTAPALRTIRKRLPETESIEQYEIDLNRALSRMKECFSKKGIGSVSHLDFKEQERTMEGRLQKKKKRSAGTAAKK